MLKLQHILIRACCASKTPAVSLGVKFIAFDDKTKQYYARNNIETREGDSSQILCGRLRIRLEPGAGMTVS